VATETTGVKLVEQCAPSASQRQGAPVRNVCFQVGHGVGRSESTKEAWEPGACGCAALDAAIGALTVDPSRFLTRFR